MKGKEKEEEKNHVKKIMGWEKKEAGETSGVYWKREKKKMSNKRNREEEKEEKHRMKETEKMRKETKKERR